MMLTLGRCRYKKIQDFTFVTTYIRAIAGWATNLANDALSEAIITLVLGKSKRQCFEYFFEKVLQREKFQEKQTGKAARYHLARLCFALTDKNVALDKPF